MPLLPTLVSFLPFLSKPQRTFLRRFLLALGMKPGPSIGSLLKDIRDKQLSEELLDRDSAVQYAREQIRHA